MFRRITTFFNPEHFQGWHKRKKYFEGWYYKIVNAAEDCAYAIIPGIAIDEQGNKQAFVQWLDGKKRTAKYFKFHGDEFRPRHGKLDISIADNQFTDTFIRLNLPGITGTLKWHNPVSWPKPFYSPGIMGPYAFAPFMECYHGIVSMDHGISGILSVDGQQVSFEDGRGYTEKDWGRSFPSAYIWMQSNHFSQPGTSLKLSVAKIPWIRHSFNGFIAGFWHQNKLIRFTTYNKTKLKLCNIDLNQVTVLLQNKNYSLQVDVKRPQATELASPILGLMDGRIEESMTAETQVILKNSSGQTIFEDHGRNTGLEVAGQVEELLT